MNRVHEKRGINSPPPAMHCIDAVRRVDGDGSGTRCKQVKNNRPKKKYELTDIQLPLDAQPKLEGSSKGLQEALLCYFLSPLVFLAFSSPALSPMSSSRQKSHDGGPRQGIQKWNYFCHYSLPFLARFAHRVHSSLLLSYNGKTKRHRTKRYSQSHLPHTVLPSIPGPLGSSFSPPQPGSMCVS